jgi:hypothetical protein
MKKMKVSFDFDDTLSTERIQEIAKLFVERGYDVYITTARRKHSYFYNNDIVFETAKKVGIKKENITFTDSEDKFKFLKEFDLHFDNDEDEIELINEFTKCIGILI